MLNESFGALLHFFISLISFTIEELEFFKVINLLDPLTWFGHQHAEKHFHEALWNQSISVQLPCMRMKPKEIRVPWLHLQEVEIAIGLVLRRLERRSSERHYEEKNSQGEYVGWLCLARNIDCSIKLRSHVCLRASFPRHECI